MRTEKSLGYLRCDDLPRMTQAAMSILGVAEAPGDDDNPIIIGWARVLKLDDEYRHDKTPWCGLAEAIVVHLRNNGWTTASGIVIPPLPKEMHVAIPKGPLWALNWRAFGVKVDRPVLGDVMVKSRNGGGHVTQYAGETATHYLCLGGNQSDRMDFALIRKDADWSFRRVPYRVMPATATPVFLDIPNLADRLANRRED